MRHWLALLRPGDWLVMAGGAVVVGVSLPLLWQGGFAERAIIRQNGQVFAEADLRSRRNIEVPGPLGTTHIAIEPGRARVVADPGPRQYCVRQGWLTQPNAIAICAPSHISLSIAGRASSHDSLAY